MPTALLSVYDKSGIVELASALDDAGWTLVSSGGTAAAVAAAGVPVTDVADITGVPAILDHRVVTLHPRIHGGILADPTKASHQIDMAQYGISAIDLVVVNLYPFESDRRVEQIDIGGPAMVRAAAKNFAHVGVVVDPADYGVVVEEIVPRPDRPADKPMSDVRVNVFVERDSQKAIIIGRGGSRLREVGTNARAGIERLLGHRVHLDLHVKVAKDWQRDPKQLQRLGF